MQTQTESRRKLRLLLSAAANLAAALLTAYAVSTFFTRGGEGNMQVWGRNCFMFFTVDSNILAAAASVLMLVCELKRKEILQWVLIVKFVGTTAVGVTFFTVVFFLGPLTSYQEMFAGAGLYLHLIVPLLEILSFCLWEQNRPLTFRESLWGVLPTFVYGTLYLVMVIIVGAENGGWNDFYGFNLHGLWYVSYLVMHAATLGLCQLLRLANRAAGRNAG